jgi:hypothetical protein
VDASVSVYRQRDITTLRTANNGVVRFDLVEPGERRYFVRNPVGYTGGGEENLKTVTVESGKVAKTTFVLTSTSPAIIAP